MLARSVLLLILSVYGCCDKTTRRIQPHWLMAGEPYELVPLQLSRVESNTVVELEIKQGRDTRGDPFNGEQVMGFVSVQRGGFWLDLTNKSNKPIRVLWPLARYVDELGHEHRIYAQPRGPLPDLPSEMATTDAVTVQPGERYRPTVVPVYKQRLLASGCREMVPYREPLIPTNLTDVRRFPGEASVRAYVNDLAKRQAPVKLVMPVEIDGKWYQYTFSFVLRNRWADMPKKQ